jgi:hypothetical protein
MSDITDKTQDVNIWNDEYTKKVSVITDSSYERLAVNALISNNESPTKYQLKADYDATGDSVGTGADVTLYTYTGTGVIDFIGVTNAISSNYEVALFIDGTERFRITMSALGTDLSLTSGSTPLWTDTANKNFRYVPTTEVGFTTSFAVKAKSTTGTQTLKHITLFREKVT